MSDIQIHLDEDNELRFGVAVEGAESGNITCRMVLESPNSAMGIIFPGRSVEGGEVKVMVPSLKSFLNEGVYPMKLEVMVDDRVFTPLVMDVELKQSVKVTAEAKITPRRKKGPSVTASVLSENQDVKAQNVVSSPSPRRHTRKNIDQQRKIQESRRAKAAKEQKAIPEDKELRSMLLDLFKKDV